MKIKDDDKIGIKESCNKQYIPLNNNYRINKTEYFTKFIFVFIFSLVIVFLVFIQFKGGKNQIKNVLSKEPKRPRTMKSNDEFLEKLKIFLDRDEIFENEMMDKHTTFQIGGPAKFFIKPKSINKLTIYYMI